MISEKPPEEISFFEALAQIVQQSGLRQADIVKGANARIIEKLEKLHDEEFMQAILPLVLLDKSTVSRAVSAIDSIRPPTLYRIGLGLELDPETRAWLEDLRKQEDKVNHSTTQQKIVVVKESSQPSRRIPRWIYEE